MQYITKVMSIDFSNESSKQAYLDASAWVAQNILSNKSNISVDSVTWTIKRKPNGHKDINTFTLTIYSLMSDEDVREQHCRICRETHKLFYMNENDICHECKLNAYFTRADDMAKVKKNIVKTKIDGRYGYADD